MSTTTATDTAAPRTRRPALFRRLPRLRQRIGGSDPYGPPARQALVDASLLAADVAIVDSELVPAFQRSDETAVRAQNRFARRELGLLVLSGLLLIAASVQAAVGNEGWPGVVVAALGGASAVLSNAARSDATRNAFLRHRREAERLRSLAWTFLTDGVGAVSDERARRLAEQVATIRLKNAQGTAPGALPATQAAPAVPTREPSEASPTPAEPRATQLAAAYRAGRLRAQRDWYLERQVEFETAERQGIRLRTSLLVLATVLGALSPAVQPGLRPWLGVTATFTTALAAVITGWMRLQAFGVRAQLYEVTAARLDLADAQVPLRPTASTVSEHLGRCEDIILAEHGLWSDQTPRTSRETEAREPT